MKEQLNAEKTMNATYMTKTMNMTQTYGFGDLPPQFMSPTTTPEPASTAASGFAVAIKFTPEQLLQMQEMEDKIMKKIQEKVAESDAYLTKLRSSKSSDRPKMTMAQKLKDKKHFLYEDNEKTS